MTLLGKAVRLGCLSVAVFASANCCGAEDIVKMAPFRATPSTVYFRIQTNPATEIVSAIIVTEVKVGSLAEAQGIRKGDHLVSINGHPTAGQKRSDLVNDNHQVKLRGVLVFSRSGGPFKKEQLLTVETSALRKKPPNSEVREPSSKSAPSTAANEPRQP